MGTLAFLPWFSIDAPVDVGNVVLEPYSRNAPDSETQRTLNQVLQAYQTAPGQPIESATLFRFLERSVLDDLSEDDRAELFDLSELVAFSGLCERKFFFLGGVDYVNRDNYQFFIQGFEETGGGVTTTMRRRDGRTTNLILDGFGVQKPDHVHPPFLRAILDTALLASLTSFQGDRLWPQIFEAIFCFNQADTDNPAVQLQSEAVWTLSAFERFFNLNSGKDQQLTNLLDQLWVDRKRVEVDKCPRLAVQPRQGRTETVLRRWIRDLYLLRNDHAHGRRARRSPGVWKLEEHLLLAAHAFPLLVKYYLARAGVYTLSSSDRTGLNAFEQLLCCSKLMEHDDSANGWPWSLIISREGWNTVTEEAVVEWEELQKADEQAQ